MRYSRSYNPITEPTELPLFTIFSTYCLYCYYSIAKPDNLFGTDKAISAISRDYIIKYNIVNIYGPYEVRFHCFMYIYLYGRNIHIISSSS